MPIKNSRFSATSKIYSCSAEVFSLPGVNNENALRYSIKAIDRASSWLAQRRRRRKTLVISTWKRILCGNVGTCPTMSWSKIGLYQHRYGILVSEKNLLHQCKLKEFGWLAFFALLRCIKSIKSSLWLDGEICCIGLILLITNTC